MGWMTIGGAFGRLPRLLATGRLEFDFDGIPLRSGRLSMRRMLNLMGSGLSQTLRCERMWGLPPLIQIEPTNCCDLRCALCPTGTGEAKRPRGYMSMETFDRVLAEVGPDLLCVYLYGWGEPFLHPRLPEMIAGCSERRILTLASTNGQHLQTVEEALDVVDAGLSALVIAMDGASQEAYESYRRGGDLERVKKCAVMVEEAKRRRGSPLPYTCLRMVMTRANEGEVVRVRHFAEEAGVNMFSCKTLGMCPQSDIYASLETSRAGAQRFSPGGNRRGRGSQMRCPYPFRQPTVFWDGTVVGCEYDYAPAAASGKIGEQSFAELWNGGPARRLRRAILSGRGNPAFCGVCPYRGMGDGSVLVTEELRAALPGR